jgi:hypothetical protein
VCNQKGNNNKHEECKTDIRHLTIPETIQTPLSRIAVNSMLLVNSSFFFLQKSSLSRRAACSYSLGGASSKTEAFRALVDGFE